MIGRHDIVAVFLDKTSPDIMHYGLRAEESLISGRAAEKDHLGPYEHELLSQKGLAAVDLFRCGSPVLGRPAFRDIADIADRTYGAMP